MNNIIKAIGYITVGILIGSIGYCNYQKQNDICTWETNNFYNVDSFVVNKYIYVEKEVESKTIINDSIIYTYLDSFNNIFIFDTITVFNNEIVNFTQEIEWLKDSLVYSPILNQYFARKFNIGFGIEANHNLNLSPSVNLKFNQNQFGIKYNPITNEKTIYYIRWLFKPNKKKPKTGTIRNTR